MARALSQDLRDRVVAATDDGMSCRAAAARFGVGVATAVRWRRMARDHGRAIAGKPGGDQRSSKTDIHADRITAMLVENGDIRRHLKVCSPDNDLADKMRTWVMRCA